MGSIFYKIFQVSIWAAVFVVLTGCNHANQITVNAVAKEPARTSAWLAYWDLDAGVKDLTAIDRHLTKLSYFAAYFDPADHVFIPLELNDQKNSLKNNREKYETYLTVVNDKQNADGSVVLKDTEVLRRLFADEASMERHADEIIALALQGGYDGIEIDYERIWKDEQVGRSFLQFAHILYGKALENKLKLRIVLEPSAPFAADGFFAGPEYVVMLYNLYGLHSDPGPKANKEFIQKIITRMRDLPGERAVAFSTGGCLWSDNGEKRFLTELEAKTLAATHGAVLRRDEGSQCEVFDYEELGVSYHVWYADVKTLNYWIATAQELGENNISLWRLGGNVHIDKINR